MSDFIADHLSGEELLWRIFEREHNIFEEKVNAVQSEIIMKYWNGGRVGNIIIKMDS
jgi:hypothetical protein